MRRGARIAARKQEVAAAAAPSHPAKPCFWCWHLQPDHAPEQCPEKQDAPNMPEYSRGRVVRTRSSGLPKTKTGRGKPSGRTKEQQAAHEATYGKVYMQRRRDLIKAAKAAFAAHRERVDAPILPHGGGAADGLMYTVSSSGVRSAFTMARCFSSSVCMRKTTPSMRNSTKWRKGRTCKRPKISFKVESPISLRLLMSSKKPKFFSGVSDR